MPIPTRGDIARVEGGRVLIVGNASGADIAYGHRFGSTDPTALIEVRDVAASNIVPATPQTRALVDRLRNGILPSSMPVFARELETAEANARFDANRGATRTAAPVSAGGTGNS